MVVVTTVVVAAAATTSDLLPQLAALEADTAMPLLPANRTVVDARTRVVTTTALTASFSANQGRT
jgi:hypothetical protein